MIEYLMWGLASPFWMVGGAFAAKRSIASSERRCIEASIVRHEHDAQNVIQDKMDPDDWIGAATLATFAFVFTPVIAGWWGIKKLARPFKKPAVLFFKPPLQKEFDQHVELMEGQKELILLTAKTYRDVMGWEPENHPDRLRMLETLQEDIEEQLRQLMRMSNKDSRSGWDANYLDEAKSEIKALTAGTKW